MTAIVVDDAVPGPWQQAVRHARRAAGLDRRRARLPAARLIGRRCIDCADARRPPSLSVIVPVYNEAEEIATIVPAVRDTLQARGGEWEILVVDNASDDDTDRAAWRRSWTTRASACCATSTTAARATRSAAGCSRRSGELRLMCDADCAPSLVSLPAMEALIGEATSSPGPATPPTRRSSATSRCSAAPPAWASSSCAGGSWASRCATCSAASSCSRAAAAQDVFSRSRIDGWAFDVEALALARALGYRVRACGITWTHRPGSRLSIPRVVIPVLRELVAARSYVRGQAADAPHGRARGDRPAGQRRPGNLSLQPAPRRDLAHCACCRARALVLLAGPVALAFFSGGYFAAAPATGRGWWPGRWSPSPPLVARRPLPQSRVRPLVTVAGLGLLAAWTLLSFVWSPMAGTAYGDGQRVILYLGVLLAATCAAARAGRSAGGARGRRRGAGGHRLRPVRAPAPVAADLSAARSSAQGRLEQPLTYWNAMGAVAAIGLVLCAHLAGDASRPARSALAAAAAAAPLGLGLYSASRAGPCSPASPAWWR